MENQRREIGRLLQSVDETLGKKPASKQSDTMPTAKAWNCVKCDLLHNNPKCRICRGCSHERAKSPSEATEQPDGAKQAMASGTEPRSKGKGKGKGKTHSELMRQLTDIEQAAAPAGPTQDVSMEEAPKDNLAQVKELQAIIAGLESMPKDSEWVQEALRTHKASLESLKRPNLSAAAEMSHVLKMEAASMVQFEHAGKQLATKLSQAKEQLEQAKKLVEEATQEQATLKEQRQQAVAQFATTKRALDRKQGTPEESTKPAEPPQQVQVIAQQAVDMVKKTASTFVPSQEMIAQGISPEHIAIVLQGFSSQIVLDTVVAEAQAAAMIPVETGAPASEQQQASA